MQLTSSHVALLLRFIVIFALCYRTMALVKLPPNASSVPAVLAFGDSIVDSGNNNNIKTLIKCNFPPYGKDFQGGNPTGRFCNGKIPSDLIGNLFSLHWFLAFISDFSSLVNYSKIWMEGREYNTFSLLSLCLACIKQCPVWKLWKFRQLLDRFSVWR